MGTFGGPRIPDPAQSGTSPFAPTQVAPAAQAVPPTQPAPRFPQALAEPAPTPVMPTAQPPLVAPPIPPAQPQAAQQQAGAPQAGAPQAGAPQAGVYPAAQQAASRQADFAPTQAVPSLQQQPQQPQPPAFQFPPPGHQAPSLPQTPQPQPPQQPEAEGAKPGSQSYRIRLRTPDGKRFDGPDITTGPKATTPWDNDPHVAGGMTVVPAPPSMSTPWGVDDQGRKLAPKVVVKLGKREKGVHVLGVLLISAVLCAPLGWLMKQAIDKHLDQVARTITVPTRVNELTTTSEIYLGGMVAVVLVVAVCYRIIWKRRHG